MSIRSIRLFEPLTIRGVTIKNRLWLAPMCMYSAVDGVVDDWHLMHYGSLAAGGFGLVTAEATAVSPQGRITRECAGLWDDGQVGPWRRVVDMIHRNGALAGVQLGHSGRKGSVYNQQTGRVARSVPLAEGGWQTVAPSAIGFPGLRPPAALDEDGLAAVVGAFAEAARRADEAGFDVVELHSAHGYLLHEFLSPLSNQRTDDYGGSLVNRARLVREVCRAVRAAFPAQKLVMARFSATDWLEGGLTPDDVASVINWLAEDGLDMADISSASLLPALIPLGPGYQVPLARHVKARVGIPISAVGLITSAPQAEQILVDGSADAVRVGRIALGDPHWPLRAARELGVPEQAVPLPQYTREFLL